MYDTGGPLRIGQRWLTRGARWAAVVCVFMAARAAFAQEAPAAQSVAAVRSAAPAEAIAQPAEGEPATALPGAVPQATAAPGAFAGDSAQTEVAPGSRFTRAELEPLISRLEADGFARDLLQRVFFDERLHRVDRVITYNVLNPDSERLYEQFQAPFAIKLARQFRRHHERILADIQARTSVSPDVIVGILLVETQFGTAALRYRLLEVFTTLIVDANPAAVDRHFRRLRAEVPGLDRTWMEERLAKKAAWAYDELKNFLSIRDRIGVDSLYEVKGSYAGAFGMPQFVPSSYAQWAVDGNHDRRIDLDNPSDAMASIANFLVQHGWRSDATLEQKMRSVWEYNRSLNYVHTIFGIALAIERPSAKRGSAPPEPEPRTAQAAELDPQRVAEAAARTMTDPRLPSSPGPARTAPPAPDSLQRGPAPARPVPPAATPQADRPAQASGPEETPLM